MDASSRQAIEDLRDIIQLTEKAVEEGLGGTLTMEARAQLSAGVSRAFELGAAYGRTRQPQPVNAEQDMADTVPPPTGYIDDYAPPPTPFLGTGRRRIRVYDSE